MIPKIKYYFTLEEVLKKVMTAWAPYQASDVTVSSIHLTQNITYPKTTNHEDEALKLVWARNYREIAVMSENETLSSAEVLDFYVKVFNILVMTADRFNALLDAYATEKTHLLDAIKTGSVNRFNDTPQDEGTFEDDEHTTNLTEYEGTADGMTPIKRLQEIQESYDNVLAKWAHEFDIMFIEEENVNEVE